MGPSPVVHLCERGRSGGGRGRATSLRPASGAGNDCEQDPSLTLPVCGDDHGEGTRTRPRCSPPAGLGDSPNCLRSVRRRGGTCHLVAPLASSTCTTSVRFESLAILRGVTPPAAAAFTGAPCAMRNS